MLRIRDFGVIPGVLPTGFFNAITDVPGVRVGHATVNRDVNGVCWRTGVTALWPHGGDVWRERVYAATFPLNGYGEMTARTLVDEWGTLDFPIMLTGTNNVGIVCHWTCQYLFEHGARADGLTSLLPMVAECDDSYLDGSYGNAISKEDVYAALDTAASGPVAEGCVGGGMGMQLFGYKGGIGTSSRVAAVANARYTVGALVMTNFGDRPELRIDGIPVGRILSEDTLPATKDGSCIVVLATDAPLNPRQCQRLAKRAALGLARTGSTARDSSGEIIVAFATGNILRASDGPETTIRTLVEGAYSSGASPFNALFTAAIEATEEAVYNALVSATTMTGVDGHLLESIPHDRLRKIIGRYRKQ
jgi:D-aminopeptidase